MSTNKLNGLTAGMIDSISDDDLPFDIFEKICNAMPQDLDEEIAVAALNPPCQDLYLIFVFEGQVNNGGFNQYYYNTEGKFYKLLPEALRRIGAGLFADLTQQANRVYEANYHQINKFNDGTLEGFSKSYDNNPLNEFDDKFYDLYSEEDLQQLQANYIRINKHNFVD
ncbi:DMP19 family protein [Mucilaginibacter terrae]|uniref:DNA mimic protein DMP19 C-terminal domain-containing protein n=1 Tax=Mucilaginibacter terrae TaxID=1955052 RepID=A0ABU3H0T8_9SPHI|nr:DUF4375 domain-containing protein [Mucilaginibacter terrae]MDT3405630.1 hypothetical protein [Mucilaginibacter terrae]